MAKAYPAASPLACIIRVNPVGAMPKVRATALPSAWDEVSTIDTLRSTHELN